MSTVGDVEILNEKKEEKGRRKGRRGEERRETDPYWTF